MADNAGSRSFTTDVLMAMKEVLTVKAFLDFSMVLTEPNPARPAICFLSSLSFYMKAAYSINSVVISMITYFDSCNLGSQVLKCTADALSTLH